MFRTVSLNHLFGNTLLLLSFIPYFFLFYNKSIIINKYTTFLLVPLIYFTFHVNSYTYVPLSLGIMVLSVLVFYIRNKKIPLWSVVGIISAILGFIYL